VRQHRLRAEEGRFQVDGDGAVEIGLGEVVELTANRHPGVVDKHVHAAELTCDGCQHIPHRAAVRNVGADCHGVATEPTHGICHRESVRFTRAVVHRHVGAGLRQRHGDRLADAAPRARHQCDTAL